MIGDARRTPDRTPDDRSALVATPAAEPSLADESAPMRVVQVERFEPPVGMEAGARESYLRRFSVLIVDESKSRSGGLGRVDCVTNAKGERFALKTLLPASAPEDASATERERRRNSCEAAFRHEYACHQALSGLKGFPKLYGWGYVEGMPAIVMEWIEGETLSRAAQRLAIDDDGRLSPLLAARIGRDLFELLVRMDLVDGRFSHRDISPGNVMVRTARLSVEEQAEEGVFDLCLVDFGSSVLSDAGIATTTEQNGWMRHATPAYAPPEMLTDDVPRLIKLRKSPAVDVYAAGSVVYELLCGRAPYDVSAPEVSTPGAAGAGSGATFSAKPAPPSSMYRRKTEQLPRPMVFAHRAADDLGVVLVREPEVAVAAERAAAELRPLPSAEEVREALSQVDDQLEGVIASCLSRAQRDRPKAAAVRDALGAFCFNYAGNIGKALRGEPLVPCSSGAASDGFAGSPFHARNVLRMTGKAVSTAVWGVSSVATGILVDGAEATLSFGQASWAGEISGVAVACALAAPGAVGALVSMLQTDSRRAFVRSTSALAIVAAAAFGGWTCFDPADEPLRRGIVAALFCSVAAGWCPLVLDFALPAPVSRVRTLLAGARRRLGLAAGRSRATSGASLPAGAAGSGMPKPASEAHRRPADDAPRAEERGEGSAAVLPDDVASDEADGGVSYEVSGKEDVEGPGSDRGPADGGSDFGDVGSVRSQGRGK